MTPRQQEIYTRCRARARTRLNWHDDFVQQLLQMQPEERAAAREGHWKGIWERIRDLAEREEKQRKQPVYSGRR